MTALIELHRVCKAYGSGRSSLLALDDVTLTVDYGEFVALRGASGSGKSTLLNILGCLDRPSAGQYLLGGSDVSELDRETQAWVRLHHIGFVFQTFHLIAHASALENVSIPLYYAGIERKEREARARKSLERVGLAEREAHRPSELSGGERQRVALARALALHPPLLLADEPTGALDTRTGNDILQLLLELRASERLTMVIVTHDPNVGAYADRQVHLSDGAIVHVEEDGHAAHA